MSQTKTKSSLQKTFFRPIPLIVTGIIILIIALLVHPFDSSYRNFIQHCSLKKLGGTFDAFLELIRIFGKGDIVVLIAVVIAAKGFRKAGVKIAVSIIIMAIFVNSLKYTVQRERPNGKNNVSFPSGDTATASAFFSASAAQCPSVSPAFVIAPAVGFVRTYDDWHYLSDVVAGLAFGIISAGLAFFVNCQPFKLLQNCKPRLFALAAVIMILIMFLPEAIRGGGQRLIFTEFFGPALFIWLASSYSALFVFENTAGNKFFSKLFVVRKNINTFFANKITGKTEKIIFSRATAITFALIPLCLIIYCWSAITYRSLLYSLSGLTVGLIAAIITISRQYKNRKNSRSAIQTLINSIFIIILFIFITLTPALVRYNKYCQHTHTVSIKK